MKEENKVDFGSIQIHKKVLAEITVSALSDVEGVSLAPKSIGESLLEYFGYQNNSAVHVSVDKNNDVTISVKVNVRYGLNMPDVARHIQDVIRTAVNKTVDIKLKEINVNIQGIERGKK